MASLSSKIKIYCENNNIEVDFSKDVLVYDDMINNVSNPYIKEWNLDIAKPTQEQLDALEEQANIYEQNQQIISTRKSLYGSWEKQLEEIYDNGIDSWKARIQQIKTDNPKQ